MNDTSNESDAHADADADADPTYEPLEPERLTWAVLLARWVEFARGSVALPEQGQAGLVRQSVADIITLQAVWFSLGQLDELESSEQALGLDRAGVLIERHTLAIHKRFADQPMPEALAELIDDVQIEYRNHQS